MQIVATFDNYEEMEAFAQKIVREKSKAGRMEESIPVQAATREIKAEPETAAEKVPEKQEAPKEEKHYTLVDVRGKLAELSKAGKKEQVQELIWSFGVEKLSQVGEEHYPALMEKAGEL